MHYLLDVALGAYEDKRISYGNAACARLCVAGAAFASEVRVANADAAFQVLMKLPAFALSPRRCPGGLWRQAHQLRECGMRKILRSWSGPYLRGMLLMLMQPSSSDEVASICIISVTLPWKLMKTSASVTGMSCARFYVAGAALASEASVPNADAACKL